MSGDILFEITKDHLETGLRGIPVGYCTTSSVDPQQGLFYRGIPVATLKDLPAEEVIYLLYHGKEGREADVETFSEKLRQRAYLSGACLRHIYHLPRAGHPMKLFAAAVLILGMLEGTGDYREDALNLIAKIPLLTAAVINHHAGWGETPPSQPDLGYIGNFTTLLQCPIQDKGKLTEVFRLFNILHYDHGGGNLSAFVGKAVASSLEDMYGAFAAALSALEGPRHGRANQDCLEFVQKVLDESQGELTEDRVEEILRKKLDNKELIFGFGHAVLRTEDVRATIFYDFCKAHFPEHPLVRAALLLREVGPLILKENPKIADPYPNVDAISGTTLTAAGFSYPEYYTVLFGMARAVGIAIQILYERLEARGGKGTPIVRPRYIYKF